MNCNELRLLLSKYDDCEVTDHGLRLKTHCYYPSFDRVAVYVSKYGEGYRITDGGEAARSAFVHGRDDQAFESSLKKACGRFGTSPVQGALVAEVENEDWLFSAILAVANGAAYAASETSTKVSARKTKELRVKMHDILAEIVPPHTIATEYMYRGDSGRLWKIDYAVVETFKPLLLKAITPDINSINSNHTTYSDIAEADETYARRFSVYETELNPEDRSLMLQVAELVPLVSLSKGARAALNR
jgi:hypothetical protein